MIPGYAGKVGSVSPRDVWAEIKKATDNILDAITLNDMVERWRQSGQPEVPDEVV